MTMMGSGADIDKRGGWSRGRREGLKRAVTRREEGLWGAWGNGLGVGCKQTRAK